LMGRSMKILHGPSTDPMALKGAIKSVLVASHQMETVDTTIHDKAAKAGQGHIKLLSAHRGRQRVVATSWRACSKLRRSLMKDASSTPPWTTTGNLPSVRKLSCHKYIFVVGLEMHQIRTVATGSRKFHNQDKGSRCHSALT
jgi:hypothetical protein